MKITKEQGKLRHSILCKISHYQWMIESMNLGTVHKAWLEDKIEELTESLAQFHPNHSLLKTGEK